MGFIPVPNAIEVVLYFTVGGQVVALTLGIRTASTPTAEDVQDAAETVDAWRATDLMGMFSDAVTALSTKATSLAADDAPTYEMAAGSPTEGGGGGTPLPNNAAAVVTFKTQQRGRSYTGRNYVFGMEESRTDSPTTYSAATIADLLTVYNALGTALVSNGFLHAVISRYHNGAPRVAGVATPITEYVADAFIDSQRRRLAGRGS